MYFNDTLRETYNIFKEFYSPLGLVSVGGSEFGDSLYYGIKYAIVQNSVHIYFSNKIFFTDSEIQLYVKSKLQEIFKNDSTWDKNILNDSSRLASFIEYFGPYSYANGFIKNQWIQ